ncbi:MAG: hypothetical protein AAGD25_21815 [Cyanobacteria bacterium P01_F01_bin.150]
MVGKSFPRPQNSASLAQSATADASTLNDNSDILYSDSLHSDIESDLESEAEDKALLSHSLSRKNALKTWSFLLIALLSCTMTGGTAAIAFLSLTALPPETDCTQSADISTDRGLLYCVQTAAQSGEMEQVLEGLEILGQWTPSDPLYYEAQASLGKWSRTVIVTARQKLRNNDLEEAIALVKKVPEASPLYDEAQGLLNDWQDQADQAQAIVTKAQDALKQKDWEQVSAQIQVLGELRAYSKRSESIRQLSEQLRLEKDNHALFQSVLQIASEDTPQAIGLALEKAGAMDRSTYAWAEAQPTLEPLAKRLLAYGGLQWKQGHLANALVTAQRVAIFDEFVPEARNLAILSQARQLAMATDTHWMPSPQHLFKLLEATAAVRQIPANSQFYAQAQDSLKSWEAQFADVSHLQFATMSAQLGWAPAVELASNQAEQLAADRPRRVQAQTIAAHWTLELERIRDRRYLIWANKLAEPGTRASLRMAITEAEKVQSDRPLFGEAQGLVYGWTREIQTKEDQPYLTLAESLARQGALQEAIQTAALIQPNRPLRNAARSAINQWQQDLWAQQQAEQRRLSRRSQNKHRTVQPGVTTAIESETKLVSNSSDFTASADTPTHQRSASHKTTNSPVQSEQLVSNGLSEGPAQPSTLSPIIDQPIVAPAAASDQLSTSPEIDTLDSLDSIIDVLTPPPATVNSTIDLTVQPANRPEAVETNTTPSANPVIPGSRAIPLGAVPSEEGTNSSSVVDADAANPLAAPAPVIPVTSAPVATPESVPPSDSAVEASTSLSSNPPVPVETETGRNDSDGNLTEP